MNRMYPSDFNVSESNSNGCFIRMDELNDMIAYGVLKLGDIMRRKEYKSCKRKKCPYYNEITKKYRCCEWNPNSLWMESK